MTWQGLEFHFCSASNAKSASLPPHRSYTPQGRPPLPSHRQRRKLRFIAPKPRRFARVRHARHDGCRDAIPGSDDSTVEYGCARRHSAMSKPSLPGRPHSPQAGLVSLAP